MDNGDRTNVHQRREAGRLLECAAKFGCGPKERRPISMDEFDTILRMAVKSSRVKRAKRTRRGKGASSSSYYEDTDNFR
jgi:hypothetical protein